MDGRVCTQERLPASDISVYFNLPAPAASQVTDVANWRIRYFYAASDPQDANINSIDITGLAGGGEVDFSLQAVPPGPVSVLIQYSGPGAGSSWTASFPCPAFGTATEKYKAATGKDDADIYISGGYSPATAATPLFSADVNLGLRSQISGSTSWQLTGSMKTDSRKKADPDSFRFRGAMVFDAASAYAFSVNMGAGMEFDRQGRARNVIASPRFSFDPWPASIKWEASYWCRARWKFAAASKPASIRIRYSASRTPIFRARTASSVEFPERPCT
ncbi:MAG: hypothetical protein WDO18_03240 [Acidobacteriota bacterium]